jgi:DNA-binding LacI/PurR family transcriptional regulator
MAAMDMMTNLLRGQPVESKRLSAELIERKSAAPPKTAAANAPKSHE